MASENQCVVAEYANYSKAEIGLRVLDMRGFDESNVSVISRDHPQVDQLEEARRDKAEKASQTASSGLGAALAAGAVAPIAIGTTLPPLFLLGPIAAAVAGAATGGIVAGTKKLGVEELLAESYQRRVAEGSVLVIVQATGDDLLEAHGGLKTTDTLSLEMYKVDLS